MVTAKYLRSIMKYNKGTGVFTRIAVTGPCVKLGDIAGTPCTDGHIQIRIFARKYSAHRLAWLYVKGRWPRGRLDHRDGNPANNRWRNIRRASPAQNSWNAKTKRNSTTGLKGVRHSGNGFIAQIMSNGVRVYLGYFRTAIVAHAAYCKAARKYHGRFARFA